MKWLSIVAVCMLLFGVMLREHVEDNIKTEPVNTETNVLGDEAAELIRLKNYTGEMKKYANQQKCNTST